MGESVDLPVVGGEPLRAELESFVSIVRHGGRPVVAAEDGRWAVILADGLIRAARDRTVIDLASAPVP